MTAKAAAPARPKTPPPGDDDILGKAYDPRIARRLGVFVRPYAGRIGVAILWMITAMLGYIAGPYLIALAIDEGIARGDLARTGEIVLLYLLAGGVFWVGTYVRVRIMARAGQDVVYDLRRALFDHMQRLSLGFFGKYAVGRLVSRVVNDVSVVREMVVWALVAVARDFVDLFGIIVAMLLLNWRLSLLSFLVLPLMAIATELFRRRARESYRRVRSAVGWVNAVLNENIVGVRVVQSFGREEHNLEVFKRDVNGNLLRASNWASLLVSVFFPSVDLIGSFALALVLYIGGRAVLGETGWLGVTLTPGTLVAFALYIDRFFSPIRDLSQRYNALQATMASGERIFELLDTPVEVADRPGARALATVAGQVDFDDVSFRYTPGGQPVLDHISLSAAPGQTVALVGETGAGKSTFVRLISRFYDASEGVVRIDGVDVRDVTQESLRQQIGVVLQDPFLFSGSIFSNIAYANPDATREQVRAAAEAVGAHGFIEKLEQGFDTLVGEGGAILSGGQRQLISFARALLADPRILILDEATSSIDTQTERVIQAALERLLAGRTAFVIAHRLSTITRADLIVVLDRGRIIEQGSHAQLLERRGRYFDLYTMAFAGHTES